MSQQSAYSLARGPFGYRPGDNCFRFTGRTQIMGAALAANSVVFAMHASPSTATVPGLEYIERVRAQWTTIVAFGTPVTAGRGLAIAPGTNVAPTGGAIVPGTPKGGGSIPASSQFDALTGGLTRIATTVALGGMAPALAFGRLGEMGLSSRGNAGDSLIFEWDFTGDDTAPLAFVQNGTNVAGYPGFVIYNPQAMDAAGTWELIVEVDTCRLPDGFSL